MSDEGVRIVNDQDLIGHDLDWLAATNGRGHDEDIPIPGEETPALPWQPVSIAAAASTPIEPPVKMGRLRYDGASKTLLSGEPGVGKSMFVATAAAAEEACAGGVVLYIDFEGVPAMLLERLEAAGLMGADLARIFYLRPQVRAEPDEIRAMVERVQPTLLIIDSYDAALAAFALTPKAEDVRAFDTRVVQPLQSTGAPLLITDHVVKRREDRGVYPIGAQDKLALADVHLGLNVATALRRGSTGRLKIKVHKDRFGHLPRAATFELRSHETTGALSWTITSEEHGSDEPFRPTGFMEKASRYLELQTEPVSLTKLIGGFRGNRDYKIRRQPAGRRGLCGRDGRRPKSAPVHLGATLPRGRRCLRIAPPRRPFPTVLDRS